MVPSTLQQIKRETTEIPVTYQVREIELSRIGTTTRLQEVISNSSLLHAIFSVATITMAKKRRQYYNTYIMHHAS